MNHNWVHNVPNFGTVYRIWVLNVPNILLCTQNWVNNEPNFGVLLVLHCEYYRTFIPKNILMTVD